LPIYEYECMRCGERTQRLQTLGEDSSGKMCLTCRAGVIRKVFSIFMSPGSAAGQCRPPEAGRFR
jgi:putative FmdB family regulatory protein